MDLGSLTSLPVDTLLQFCQPAPFGDLETMQTVLDPNVRIAMEMKAENFKFGFETNPQKRQKTGRRYWDEEPQEVHFLHYIRSVVETELLQGRDVILEPYRLNIYGVGGFFKPHVDTPVDPERMVGTVVVCLPSAHKVRF